MLRMVEDDPIKRLYTAYLEARRNNPKFAESLRDALPLFADELAGRLGMAVSEALRVSVRRQDAPGPVFTGVAVISADEGVQWIRFGM